MTRATMRTLLRKRLLETSPHQWSDADLNVLINEGLHQIQKEIMKVSPDEFLSVDQRDIVIGTASMVAQLYDKPVGMWYEKEVAIKNVANGKYDPIDLYPFWTARDLASSTIQQGVATVYAHFGRFFYLSPAPTVAITAGLQVIYVYTLDLALDTDVPTDLHPALHIAVVDKAETLALGETGEAAAAAQTRLDQVILDLPYYYRGSTQPQRLVPDIPRGG